MTVYKVYPFQKCSPAVLKVMLMILAVITEAKLSVYMITKYLKKICKWILVTITLHFSKTRFLSKIIIFLPGPVKGTPSWSAQRSWHILGDTKLVCHPARQL